mmetsp:Transcript_11870/g.18210  ORF Transcript_11870/g.18210 Transcript_11870/m.18210 type:complete len:142 (+) Transcript_11870:268-693(+)
MAVPRACSRGQGIASIRVPTFQDFLHQDEGELLEAIGMDTETVANLARKTPVYFIAHVDTLDLFSNSCSVPADDLIEALIMGRENVHGDSEDQLEAQYGRLLRFVWLVGKRWIDMSHLRQGTKRCIYGYDNLSTKLNKLLC